MDTLDGRYSRMSGKGTPFGAFLDSTLDRMEEGIVLIAVGAYFADRGDDLAVAAVVAAVLVSLMVSYTRARAEALGVECKVGIATRAVRVVILSIGLVFAKGAGLGDFELLAPAVYVLAVLTVDHDVQRICHVRRELKAVRLPGAKAGSNRDACPATGKVDSPRRVFLAFFQEELILSEPTERPTARPPRTAPAATSTTRCAWPSSAWATAPPRSCRASSTTRTPTPSRTCRA